MDGKEDGQLTDSTTSTLLLEVTGNVYTYRNPWSDEGKCITTVQNTSLKNNLRCELQSCRSLVFSIVISLLRKHSLETATHSCITLQTNLHVVC